MTMPPSLEFVERWRLFAPDRYAGAIGQSQGTVYGTAGVQDITVLPGDGDVHFDASFNRGGDIVRLPGKAADWFAAIAGSQVSIYGGGASVTIPVGTAGATIVFADGPRTLRYDPGEQAVLIGSQAISASGDRLGAAAEGPVPGPSGEAGQEARLFLLASSGPVIDGDMAVFGTNGVDKLTVAGGTVRLDPSFNRGGDAITLTGLPEDFTGRREGSNLRLEGDGIDLVIPVGTAATFLIFAPPPPQPEGWTNELRELLYDPQTQAIMLGAQAIGFDPVTLAYVAVG